MVNQKFVKRWFLQFVGKDSKGIGSVWWWLKICGGATCSKGVWIEFHMLVTLQFPFSARTKDRAHSNQHLTPSANRTRQNRVRWVLFERIFHQGCEIFRNICIVWTASFRSFTYPVIQTAGCEFVWSFIGLILCTRLSSSFLTRTRCRP